MNSERVREMLEEEERMNQILAARLEDPANYTQSEIVKIEEQISGIEKQKIGTTLQIEELRKEIPILVSAQTELIRKKQTLEASIPQLQEDYAVALGEHDSNPAAHKEMGVTQARAALKQVEEQINKIDSDLNQRYTKELELASLEVKLERLEAELATLRTQANPETMPLDLVTNNIGRELFYADFKEAYGQFALTTLKRAVYEAELRGESYLVPKGTRIIDGLVETKEPVKLADETLEAAAFAVPSPVVEPVVEEVEAPVVEAPVVETTPEVVEPLVNEDLPVVMPFVETPTVEEPVKEEKDEEILPTIIAPVVLPFEVPEDKELEDTPEEVEEPDEDKELDEDKVVVAAEDVDEEYFDDDEIYEVESVEDTDEEQRMTFMQWFRQSAVRNRILLIGLAGAIIAAAFTGLRGCEPRTLDDDLDVVPIEQPTSTVTPSSFDTPTVPSVPSVVVDDDEVDKGASSARGSGSGSNSDRGGNNGGGGNSNPGNGSTPDDGTKTNEPTGEDERVENEPIKDDYTPDEGYDPNAPIAPPYVPTDPEGKPDLPPVPATPEPPVQETPTPQPEPQPEIQEPSGEDVQVETENVVEFGDPQLSEELGGRTR